MHDSRASCAIAVLIRGEGLEKQYLEALAVLLLAVRLLAVAAPLVLADDTLRRLDLLNDFGVKRL